MKKTARQRQKNRAKKLTQKALLTAPALLVLALLAGISQYRHAPDYTAAFTVKFKKLFDQTSALSREDKISFWSEALMRDPRLIPSLGNTLTAHSDSAPLFPNKYDCTTYIETVAALAKSTELSQIVPTLIKIRYKKGIVGYATRNHFPEADWIPNNEFSGQIKDSTFEVARRSKTLVSFAYKTIDKQKWFASQNQSEPLARSLASAENLIDVKLSYIPLNQVERAAKYADNGTILNIVRENRGYKPVLITHQGYLIKKNGELFFRHASKERPIRETPLRNYLAGLKKMRWRVVGMNFNTIH